MLLCDACNYYCETTRGKVRCELTKHVFTKDFGDMEKYPCENYNLESGHMVVSDKEMQKVS
jgi:hypothetical protein